MVDVGAQTKWEKTNVGVDVVPVATGVAAADVAVGVTDKIVDDGIEASGWMSIYGDIPPQSELDASHGCRSPRLLLVEQALAPCWCCPFSILFCLSSFDSSAFCSFLQGMVRFFVFGQCHCLQARV